MDSATDYKFKWETIEDINTILVALGNDELIPTKPLNRVRVADIKAYAKRNMMINLDNHVPKRATKRKLLTTLYKLHKSIKG